MDERAVPDAADGLSIGMNGPEARATNQKTGYPSYMGRSFVTADGEHGFWMSDGALELWLRLLALHVPEPNRDDSEIVQRTTHSIRDGWLLNSRGYFNGFVSAGLVDAVATTEGTDVVRSAIASLRKALLQLPPKLNKDVLNLLGFEYLTFLEDVETRRLVDIADAFLELLDGKITDTASSTARMPGSLK